MLIFTLLGLKEIFPDFQGRYMEIQQNILPENPLPTLMEMGLMISMKYKKPFSIQTGFHFYLIIILEIT